MANSYQKVGKKVVADLQTNVKGANKVANNAYKSSLSTINNTTNKAKQSALAHYNASKNNLKKTGMSGTTKNKLEVNYGNNVSTVASANTAAKSALKTSLNNAKTTNTTNYYSQKATANKTYSEAHIKKTEADRQEKMKIYKQNVGRFDTVKKCDAAIKKLKKSNDPNKAEKIAYIQSWRANLKDIAKQNKAASSGGGYGYGGGGYSYSRSGGGSSSDITVEGGGSGGGKDGGSKKKSDSLGNANIYKNSSKAVSLVLSGGKSADWKAGASYTHKFNSSKSKKKKVGKIYSSKLAR